MKKLFILAVLLTATANAQKINPIQIGINKTADSLSVSVLTFKTTDKTCNLYYSVYDCDRKQIDQGNLQLTEAEFECWGETNLYIEDLALNKLGLTRKNK